MKIRNLLFCALIALPLSSCALVGTLLGMSDGAEMKGSIYTGHTEPEIATSNTVGHKVGTAKCVSVLGLFAGGDGGISAAARNGNITKISHVDRKTVSVLGLFTTCTYYVYGE